jgi:hypothetical protein
MEAAVMQQTALVVTSIAPPNRALRALAEGAETNRWPFYIIGDVSSPSDFSLPGAQFLSVEQQIETGFATAKACPTRHYARKNIGYLLSMRGGTAAIVETDDDNLPLPTFWKPREFQQRVRVARTGGWTNVYAYFSNQPIWPRGLPLDAIQRPLPEFQSLPEANVYCPIQQNFADGNPDVDAIYRMALPLPVSLRKGRSVAISADAWCPFNSQNTTWARDAFPLLYLPAFCSFRMTDIWRSFVAQRIASANGWPILFGESTVFQERNEHDLMRDFEDEIPGYRHNRKIGETLAAIDVKPGAAALYESLYLCYEQLVTGGFLDSRELDLVQAWIDDVKSLPLHA